MIEGTDIIRSVAAVGHELNFSLDLTLSELPTPVYDNLSQLHAFLQHSQAHFTFAVQILQYLTDADETWNQRIIKVGDVVTAKVSVQSKAAANRVAKLSHRWHGPYKVVEATGHGATLRILPGYH